MKKKLYFLCFLFALAKSQTPLCEKCKCSNSGQNSSSLTTPMYDVNCQGTIYPELIFRSSSWLDEKNNTLPIIALNLSACFFRNISNVFPKSDILALDLANNSITQISSGVFANLEKLDLLILSKNELQEIQPDAFKGNYHEYYFYPLLSLTKLMLEDNSLRTLDKDLFEHTPNLQVLSLAGNPLKFLDQQTVMAIISIPRLAELDLSRNQLATLPVDLLHAPKNLLKLNLSSNAFESVPKELANSSSLQVLYFNGNPIPQNFTHKIAFPHMKVLNKLHFCDMANLVEIGAHTFGNLHALSELHICRNSHLSSIHPAAFNRKSHGGEKKLYLDLKKLHLESNNISHIDKHLLLEWDTLHDFDLSGNPWHCDCTNKWLIYYLTYISEKYENGIKWHNVPRIHHNKKFVCATPEHLKNMTLYEVSNHKDFVYCNPVKQTSPPVHSFVLTGILSAVLVITLVVGVLVYLYKKDKISYKKLSNYYTYRFMNRAEDQS